MDAHVRRLVRDRAGGRCEYCRMPQFATPSATFQIEHIRAKQHKGADDETNLALSCPRCNCFKGPNLSAIDPLTDQAVGIFDPRAENWHDHFALVGLEIIGLTSTGRATAQLLQMNADDRIRLREALKESDEINF